jgi:hypothetical protein
LADCSTFFVQAELVHHDTKEPVGPVSCQGREMMPLVGDRVAFVQRAYSSEETASPDFKAVFAFSDLSVRQSGYYRLHFSLFEVVGTDVVFRASVYSLPFKTYSPKDFPGMQSSTDTTAELKKNGIRMRWKKSIRIKPKNKEASRVNIYS